MRQVTEHVVQSLKISQCGIGGLKNVASFVTEGILCQIVMAASAWNELPEPFSLGDGTGVRVVGGFNERQEGQFRRHATFFQFLDDMEKVFGTAFCRSRKIFRFFQIIVFMILDQRVGEVRDGEAVTDASPYVDFVDRQDFSQGIVIVELT